jgi:hypothetical protein
MTALILLSCMCVNNDEFDLELAFQRATKKVWSHRLLPDKAEKFKRDGNTQSVYVLNDSDVIEQVSITSLKKKWQTSGGMKDIAGVKSVKYRTVPDAVKYMVKSIEVWNGSNFQSNRALVRDYPDGSRFDDVLSHEGIVFEHRMREKVNGRWRSKVIFSNVDARPNGYHGLKVTCASCHEEAGTGGYGEGLVPGGDTIISDPMHWSKAGWRLTPRR